jgi:hypothetical protein
MFIAMFGIGLTELLIIIGIIAIAAYFLSKSRGK